jgi:hypothetical protein
MSATATMRIEPIFDNLFSAHSPRRPIPTTPMRISSVGAHLNPIMLLISTSLPVELRMTLTPRGAFGLHITDSSLKL